MSAFDPQVLEYIPLESIPKHLAKLHPGMVLTTGHHESLVPGYIKDLEWNFYDEMHRFYVHNTYDEMYKVMAGKYFSVNTVRWKNLPIFVQVANAKIKDHMFYQTMTIFGIIYVHQVMTLTQQTEDKVLLEVNWWTGSHWLFKWLHRPFNNSLLKLQMKQDREDNEIIRGRRLDLRRRKFSFLTDEPTFINSNKLANHVILPKMPQPFRLDLKTYSLGELHRIECGVLEILIKRLDEINVEIWPGVCPHEGALIDKHHLCNEVAVCPWHGRRFSKVVLNDTDKNTWKFLTMQVIHRGTYLEVSTIPSLVKQDDCAGQFEPAPV